MTRGGKKVMTRGRRGKKKDGQKKKDLVVKSGVEIWSVQMHRVLTSKKDKVKFIDCIVYGRSAKLGMPFNFCIIPFRRPMF
jgi:hypothetical protein